MKKDLRMRRCPECGGMARLKYDSVYESYYVQCEDCLLSAPNGKAKVSKEDAVKEWNKHIRISSNLYIQKCLCEGDTEMIIDEEGNYSIRCKNCDEILAFVNQTVPNFKDLWVRSENKKESEVSEIIENLSIGEAYNLISIMLDTLSHDLSCKYCPFRSKCEVRESTGELSKIRNDCRKYLLQSFLSIENKVYCR